MEKNDLFISWDDMAHNKSKLVQLMGLSSEAMPDESEMFGDMLNYIGRLDDLPRISV